MRRPPPFVRRSESPEAGAFTIRCSIASFIERRSRSAWIRRNFRRISGVVSKTRRTVFFSLSIVDSVAQNNHYKTDVQNVHIRYNGKNVHHYTLTLEAGERLRKMAQGWGQPGASKKFHYFKDSMTSICGKWMWGPALSDPENALEDGKHEHPENCAACKKKVILLERAANAQAVADSIIV